MEFSRSNLYRLERIMTTILKADEEYEKEFGNDWGSTMKEDREIMEVINNKLGVA